MSTGDPGRFDLPPDLRAIQAELAAHQWESLEQAHEFLQRRMARYNAGPQAELGGLSPNEMQQLLSGDWNGEGPLRLNRELGMNQLSGVPLLRTARAVLAGSAQPGGIKATASGNLNRRFVATVIDPADWPDCHVDEILKYSKVVNELDVWPLHSLRVVLQRAKLLMRRKGAFHAAPRGRELLAEARAGELYAHLFRTFFRDFNLAYLSVRGDDPYEQHQPMVPLVLLRLATLDQAWRRVHELAPLLISTLDPDEDGLGLGRDVSLPHAFFRFRLRFLAPLEWFGLLEGRDAPSEVHYLPFRELRRTPLFEAFIRFAPPFLQAARRAMG